jgi:predicted NBD/HSP70 family sugar kinase
MSRADLSRVSGLQRSTISLIVDQLIEENWVLEGPPGHVPRGRRPTFLRLNDNRVIIGVDIRPSQMTVALADATGRFNSQEVLLTTPDPDVTLGRLIHCIKELIPTCQGKKIEGIGVSLPGRFDPQADRLVFAPNLGWGSVDIRGPLREATGLEVEVENAANACVLSALWFGQMQSCRNFVVVTVSEGIGTGILCNGQLMRGLGGMAGEFGHIQMDPAGPVCSCGGKGCWEVFASNRAALRYYSKSPSATPGLTFSGLLSLADQGDKAAVRALDRMAHYLGSGMRMLVKGLAPENIVVVGELARCWNRVGPLIESEVQSHLLPGATSPNVLPANEAGLARLRGTIALVLQSEFGLVS